MQRCGTRQFADFLKKDPRVCLQGEVSRALFPAIHNLVVAADARYSEEKHLKYYGAKRQIAVTKLMAYFSKSRNIEKSGSMVEGFKTPTAEFSHEILARIFLPSVTHLKYLYCIRRIDDCFLSLSAMPWFKLNQAEFIEQYVSSLCKAIEIRRLSERQGSKFSIDVLNLDAFIASSEQPEWLQHRVFQPLGLDLSLEQVRDIAGKTDNTNSTQGRFGVKRETAVNDAVHQVFMRSLSRIDAAVDEFNAVFNETLSTYRRD